MSDTADTTNPSQRPDDPSQAPIVFFDGVCGLCNQTVDFLMRHDHRRNLRYAPLQGEIAEQLLPDETRKNLNTLVFHSANGEQFVRSAAVVRILRHLGLFWRICAGLLWIVPKPIRDFGYRLVSRSRYRLFGRRETCRMPTEEERGLILP